MECLLIVVLGVIIVAFGIAVAPLIAAALPWVLGLGIAFTVVVAAVVVVWSAATLALDRVPPLRRAVNAISGALNSTKWYVRVGTFLALYAIFVSALVAAMIHFGQK